MGETLPEIMTPAFCRVKEATPDSTGYRFPVVGQQFWLHRVLSGGLKKTLRRAFQLYRKKAEALTLQAIISCLTPLYCKK